MTEAHPPEQGDARFDVQAAEMEILVDTSIAELARVWQDESIEFAPPALRAKLRQIDSMWRASGIAAGATIDDFNPTTFDWPASEPFAEDPETGEALYAYTAVRPQFFVPDRNQPITLHPNNPGRWILVRTPYERFAERWKDFTVEHYEPIQDCYRAYDAAIALLSKINGSPHDAASRMSLESRLVSSSRSITTQPEETHIQLAEIAVQLKPIHAATIDTDQDRTSNRD